MSKFFLFGAFFLFIVFLSRAQPVKQVIQSGHSSAAAALAFQDGCNRLLSAGLDNYIILWDAWSGRELRRWNAGVPLFDIDTDALSGRVALIGYAASPFFLLPGIAELRRGKFIHNNNIHQARFVDSGRYVLESDYNSGLYLHRFPGEEEGIKLSDAAYINDWVNVPASRDIILAKDSSIVRLNPFSRSQQTIARVGGRITHLTISGSGRYLYFSERHTDHDFIVSVMDLFNAGIKPLHKTDNEIIRIMVTRKNDLLVIASLGGLKMLDLAKNSEKEMLIREAGYNQVAACISPDENYLASAYASGKIVLWDIASGSAIKTFGGYGNGLMTETALLESPARRLYTSNSDGYIRVWDIPAQKLLYKFQSGHTYAPFTLDFAAGNDLIAISSGKISLLNSARQEVMHAGTRIITHACVSPDKKFIVSCKEDSLLVTNATTGIVIQTWRVPANELILQVAISHNSREIAVADGSGAIWLYVIGRRPKRILARFEYPCQGLSFSNNDRYLCAGARNSGMIHLIRLSDKAIRQWKGHTQTVTRFCWLTDTGFISGDETGEIKEWDLKGRQKGSYEGHTQQVTALLTVPGTNIMISAALDGAIKCWNSKRRQLLSTLLPVGAGTDNYIAYTPSGYYSGTKQGIRAMSFLKDSMTYGFEQYDCYYNRPDTLLEMVGLASGKDISFLKKMLEKRAIQTGINPLLANAIQAFSNSPEVYMRTIGSTIPRTFEKRIELIVDAADSISRLTRLFVYVNGVPLFGSHGKSLDFLKPGQQLAGFRVPVELSRGENSIEASVMNEKQVESLRKSLHLIYVAER